MITIRSAQAAEAEAICAIWNPVIRDTQFTFTTREKTTAAVRDLIAAVPQRWLVAQTDAVVGFVMSQPFRAGPGYAQCLEHSVYVAGAAAGQGVGSALLTAYEKHAAAQGAHVLVAGISGVNDRAIGFHAARGYVQVARMPEVGCKGGIRLDLVLMQKIIGPVGGSLPDSGAFNP